VIAAIAGLIAFVAGQRAAQIFVAAILALGVAVVAVTVWGVVTGRV
jgi:hypothetical protein